jgi:hypothetical protein
MASLNFDESIVLILFAQSGGDVGASREELVQFDSNLQTTFGAKLLTIMGEEGMAADIHNRSVVLGCRPHMAGNTPDLQIRNACRYVLHAQQELGAPAISAFRAFTTAAVAAAPARKHRKARAKSRRRHPSPRSRKGTLKIPTRDRK